MTIPSGVQKLFVLGKETTWGTAPAAGSGKKMRRVTATLDLIKGTFESAEIRSDQQVVDYRHGMRRVEGSLNGELSCKSYQDLFAACFRAAWVAGVTTGAQTNISSAANAYTRGTGSFVTDGFKIGDLILVSGFSTSTANGQFIVTAVTATVLTVDGPNIGVDAGGESVTILVDGRKLQVPSTGHTNDSFTFESLYEMGATDVSELSVGCRISSFNIGITPGGMCTVSFGILGKEQTSDSTLYFTTPAAEDTTGVLSGPVGTLYKDGVAIATVTGLTIEGNMGAEVGEVVGSIYTPDVFMGRFRVTGSMSCYFENDSLWQAFSAETELSLVMRLNAGVDQVMVLKLPRIKLGGNTKDDKETGGIIQNMPFVALKYIGAGNQDGTTMVIQDTEAV